MVFYPFICHKMNRLAKGYKIISYIFTDSYRQLKLVYMFL